MGSLVVASCEIGSTMNSVWLRRVLISLSFTVTVLLIESELGVQHVLVGGGHMEHQLGERAEHVKEVCRQHQDQLVWTQSSFRRNLKKHVWDFTHGLAYCPIAKVASTAWFHNFLEIMKIDIQGLESLQESGKVMTEESSFIKKGKRGKISKINSS